MAQPEDVFDPSTTEDAVLEQLGYQQEFKRSFSLLDMIGFSFSIVTCWTALNGVFIIGVQAGGPPVIIFGWIGVSVFTILIALAMAEMCSRWPVAGGQYTWVAMVAPPRVSRQLSYVTGWFMLTGILAMGAVNNSFASNYILGMANLVFPEYVIQRWHTVLVAWCVGVIALGVNVFAPHLLHRISRLILLWNISTFVIIIATLLATNNHKQDASFVFHDFQNMTGFAKPMAVMVGIVQPLFGMCCYDAASHMSEEMNRPSRDAPKAIILSVLLGAGTGFVFLITVCFCISDIEGAQTTSTGVPIIQVLYESTRSKPAACILTGMITVITIVTSVSLTAEGSRSVYAFARDRGLPFSSHLSKVNPRMKIPVLALLLTLTIQVALNAIYFGTSTGFNTVVSIASTGFYISYGLALFARLLGYFENKWTLSTYTHTHTHTNTYKYAYALPLPLSLSFNALGLLFLVFAIIVFNFPSESPVDSESMNYTCAAVALVGCLSAVTWFTSARFRFSEPVVSTGALDGEDGEDGGRGSLSAADLGGGDVKFKGG